MPPVRASSCPRRSLPPPPPNPCCQPLGPSPGLHPRMWRGSWPELSPNACHCLISAGSASRRCLLSAQGVAYWGLPSFARCISHEYRYLYLSVSVHGWVGGEGIWCVPSPGRSLRLIHSLMPWDQLCGFFVWQTPTPMSGPLRCLPLYLVRTSVFLTTAPHPELLRHGELRIH